MMEAARGGSSGRSASAANRRPVKQASREAVRAPDEHGERFPGLDMALLSHAARIDRELREMDVTGRFGKHAAALATQQQKSETRQHRAARFFTTHGMSKVAQLLGDELSASEAAKVKQEQAKAEQRFLAKGNTAATATGSSAGSDFEADSDEETNRQRWKAVDELRRRAKHV